MGTFKYQNLTCLSDHCASLIQRSLVNKDPCVGKPIHARIIKSGLHLGVFLMNNLMNLYAKTGLLEDATGLFNEMPVKNASSWNTIISAYAKQGKIDYARQLFVEMPEPDSVSWTAIMVGYNQMGRFENAIKMFIDMISSKVMPTQYTFTIILASCAAMKSLEFGRKVHSFIVKVGLSSYTSVANSLLNMYAKSGDLLMAESVFGRMKLKSTSSWNTLIAMHMQCKRFDLALAQFERMTDRDIVTWNSMISGYNQHGFDIEALDMFSNMLKNQVLKPDRYTLASVLSACANLDDLNLGKQIHGHIIRTEFDLSGAVGNALISLYSKLGDVKIAQKIVKQNRISNLNIIAFTALLDGYIKQGDMNSARQIFDSLRDCDVVAWTAMIVGYMQNGFNNEAMDLFRSMIRGGPEPNSYTLAAMLSISGQLLTSGLSSVHGYRSTTTAIFSSQKGLNTTSPKFTPKAPPRKTTGPLLPKSSDAAAENDREFVRKVNQRFGVTRGSEVQKKSSGNVAMSLGDGSSSTRLRSRGQPKDRNNKKGLDLSESAEKNITLSSSTATKDGDIDENPSSLADGGFESSSKTKKEYKEPWDYKKYYPVSLPWRRPGSGNPELLNAQEFGQEEYDENNINSAIELGLLENSEEKQLILFQFPPKLPLNKQTHRAPNSSQGTEKVESSSSLKEDASNKCSDLKELPDGFMGKMLVYKSGAIKLKLGDTTFDVSSGTPRECAQDVAFMNTKSKDCCVLGSVEKQALITPELSSSLTNINLQ
ncbi:hypothetical protein L6452_12444 [Arctium lappa]|uniref:Uncharacterized protein n=1 Tax=Arctium lappa TaxID=4217 RepID=A0ACB9DQY7_ARCLA|nr:hypothetical protein L6452_12444 [Arctium lappa]